MNTADLIIKATSLAKYDRFVAMRTHESAREYRGRIRNMWPLLHEHEAMLKEQYRHFSRLARDVEDDDEYLMLDTTAQLYAAALYTMSDLRKKIDDLRYVS